jgi:hypothetical protein
MPPGWWEKEGGGNEEHHHPSPPSDDLRTVGAGALESHSRSFDHGVARRGCAPAMASALRCSTRHDKPTVFGVALWLRPVPGSVDDSNSGLADSRRVPARSELLARQLRPAVPCRSSCWDVGH